MTTGTNNEPNHYAVATTSKLFDKALRTARSVIRMYYLHRNVKNPEIHTDVTCRQIMFSYQKTKKN